MERLTIFAAIIADKNFYPHPQMLSWRKSLEVAVGKALHVFNYILIK
jgi:hypothetical protein